MPITMKPPTRFRRSRRAIAASLTLTVALAACGGDDDTVASGNDAAGAAAASGDFCTDFESLASQTISIFLDLQFGPGPDALDALTNLGPLAEQVQADAPDEIANDLSDFTRGVLELPGALADVDLQDSDAVNAAFEEVGPINEEDDEATERVDAFAESECGFTMDEIAQGAFLTLSGKFCRDFRMFSLQSVSAVLGLITTDPQPEDVEHVLEAGRMAEELQADAPEAVGADLQPFTDHVIAHADLFADVDPTDQEAINAAGNEAAELPDPDDAETARLDTYLDAECGYTTENLQAEMFRGPEGEEDTLVGTVADRCDEFTEIITSLRGEAPDVVEGSGPFDTEPNARGADCVYGYGDDDAAPHDRNRLTIRVTYVEGMTTEQRDALWDHEPMTEAVPGIGDEARWYYRDSEAFREVTGSLRALSGDTMVTLRAEVPGEPADFPWIAPDRMVAALEDILTLLEL